MCFEKLDLLFGSQVKPAVKQLIEILRYLKVYEVIENDCKTIISCMRRGKNIGRSLSTFLREIIGKKVAPSFHSCANHKFNFSLH